MIKESVTMRGFFINFLKYFQRILNFFLTSLFFTKRNRNTEKRYYKKVHSCSDDQQLIKRKRSINNGRNGKAKHIERMHLKWRRIKK